MAVSTKLPPSGAESPSGRHHGARSATKRALDLVLALFMLLALLPILLVVAIVIKLDSRGGVIFRQRRLGKDMRPFQMLKFRTMADDATSDLHQRYIAAIANEPSNTGHANGNGTNGHHTGNGKSELVKLTDDPRVTSVGRMLRRSSLDELPQLFNVLSGHMSLVGPRPALSYELEHYSSSHFDRFAVRPGLTGMWQVSGRNELGFREMLDLDTEYAHSADLMTDLRILARTPRAAIGGTA